MIVKVPEQDVQPKALKMENEPGANCWLFLSAKGVRDTKVQNQVYKSCLRFLG